MAANLSPSASNSVTGPDIPKIWILLGDKLGDNRQVDPVVQALDWPCEHKHIEMREPYVLGKPEFEARCTTSTRPAPIPSNLPGQI